MTMDWTHRDLEFMCNKMANCCRVLASHTLSMLTCLLLLSNVAGAASRNWELPNNEVFLSSVPGAQRPTYSAAELILFECFASSLKWYKSHGLDFEKIRSTDAVDKLSNALVAVCEPKTIKRLREHDVKSDSLNWKSIHSAFSRPLLENIILKVR
jgi:hypothetical protein